MQTGLSTNQAYSFIVNTWERYQASDLATPGWRKIGSVRIGGKRKSSAKNSYEKSSGNGRIEKFRCTEGEGAQHLRIDELSRQKKRKSTNSEELQDNANSLNAAREFHDPETASSPGLSHVHQSSRRTRTGPHSIHLQDFSDYQEKLLWIPELQCTC